MLKDFGIKYSILSFSSLSLKIYDADLDEL